MRRDPHEDAVRRARALADGWHDAGGTAAGAQPKGRLETLFDEHTEGPGIWKWRHYFPIYERHVGHFVGASPTVLEIGVYSGGSLGMWRSYFGEGCRVVGVDIEPACRVYADDATTILIGDQGDAAFWERCRAQFPRIDVVIDDGSHRPTDQMTSVEALLPWLAPGGVYVCEDVHGIDNEFAAFAHAFADRLNEVRWLPKPPERELPPVGTSATQAGVASVSLYPFVVVFERTPSPVAEYTMPRHGTEWQPFFDEVPSKTAQPPK
jgi:hypothetical protein